MDFISVAGISFFDETLRSVAVYNFKILNSVCVRSGDEEFGHPVKNKIY